ncbi:MAG: zinc ribbon domain-containing protein, partial [Candidatus Nezhaarchaeales archaeon]
LAKNVLYDAFKRIGLELIDVKFEGIDTTPEWRDRIFFLRTGVSANEVLRMQTVQKAAESLSKSPGAAVGAGVVMIPPLFQPPPAPATQAQRFTLCPKCGFQNLSTARFCSNCGTSLQAATTTLTCLKCGMANPAGAKFCINCGSPIQPSVKCPKCGSEVQLGAKFCSNCGEKLT